MNFRKKGNLSTGALNTAVLAIVLLTVLFSLYAQLVPEAQTAGNTLNNTANLPLSGLFEDSGVVFIIIMAALIILVVKAFLPGRK